MTTLRTAREHHRLSSLTAHRASEQAVGERRRGPGAVAQVVITHQLVAARMAERAIARMLREQDLAPTSLARLNVAAFTSSAETIQRLAASTRNDFQLGRLAESLVQDAGRSAESVSVTTRAEVGYVRHLTTPSCSRCAILAGRVYRYSTGFQRHPNCDCVMVPTTVSSPPMTVDVAEMAEQGLVTGMSKADLEAIRDGADPNRIVNVRRTEAGLTESGRVLERAGRPTPEAIYRMTSTRDEAIQLLTRHGYVL